MCVCDPHPRLLTGRVSFGITKNEPDILAELDGRLVLSFRQRVENSAKVHRWFNYLQVVLEEAEGQLGYFIFHWIVFKRWQKGEREREMGKKWENREVWSFYCQWAEKEKNLNQKWKNCTLLLLKRTQGHWSCESVHIISFTTWMKRPLPQTALLIIELEPLVPPENTNQCDCDGNLQGAKNLDQLQRVEWFWARRYAPHITQKARGLLHSYRVLL